MNEKTLLGLLASAALFTCLSTEAKADATTAPPPPTAEASAAVGAKQEAAVRFERAIKLYDEADYALALAEFERVYELVPDYRVLYNIGQVSVQLGRYARALKTFRQYLKEGGAGLPADRVAQVQSDLGSLAMRTAQVEVHVDRAGAEISIDGSAIGVAPLAEPLVLDVGQHTIQVQAPGYRAQTSDLSLAGGDHRTADFTLVPEQSTAPAVPQLQVPAAPRTVEPERSHNQVPWLGWAATGTLAASAVVLEVLGASKASDLEKQRTTPGSTRSELDATHATAKAYLVGADIVGGAALLAGGVSLYFSLTPSATREHAAAAPKVGIVFAPSRVALSGQF